MPELHGGRTERVLVTGASGYIGGRLVEELLAAGYLVRCLVRSPGKLSDAPWRDSVEIVRGDVAGALRDALKDIDVAYYMIHVIGASDDEKNFACIAP